MKSLFNKQNRIYTVLTILAAIAGIILMFTNVGIDVTYQVSMAYRILKGDTMFLEMWEPHQTSAFLNVAFMWLYIKITGTTTGIVLYLQIIGILIRAVISIVLYRSIKNDLAKPVAYGIALLLFLVSPKDYAIPEFGNMQVWFCTLLFVFLLLYFRTVKVRFIFLSALSLCLLSLSYPSCVLVFIPVIILLIIYGRKETKTRDIVLFSITCLLIGFAYLIAVVAPIGTDKFLECIEGMLSLEPSHTGSTLTKILGYIKDFGEILHCYLIISVISVVPTLLTKEKKQRPITFALSSSIILLVGFLLNILSVENRCAYGVIFIYIIVLGMILAHKLTGREKTIYIAGTVLSLTCLLATLILTDLELVVSIAYAILAVGLALIPIYKWIQSYDKKSVLQSAKACSVTFILLLVFRAAYIRTPITGYGQILSSLDDLSIVRQGPAKGIITSEDSSVRERDGLKDFKENLEPDTKVMIIDGLVNSLAYMYADSEVCTPSVMSDPKYSENILKYFEINPNKMPDVLAVASYEGELDYDVRANEWLYKWITEDFNATEIKTGEYWTFYYR